MGIACMIPHGAHVCPACELDGDKGSGDRGQMNDRPIPSTQQGTRFLHCVKCIEERPEGVSPAEYARLSVSLTPIGIQVFCQRHEINVIHVDLGEGPVRANISAKGDKIQTLNMTAPPPCKMCAEGKDAHSH